MSRPSWQCHDSSPVVRRSMVVLLVLLFFWTHPNIVSDSCYFLLVSDPHCIRLFLGNSPIHVTLLGLSHSPMFNFLNGLVPLLWPEKTQTPVASLLCVKKELVEPRFGCFYQPFSVPIHVHVCTCTLCIYVIY